MSSPASTLPLTRARWAGIFIPFIAIAGLALQLGILLGGAWAKGRSGWGATANFFSYFTILSNLLVAISFAAPSAFWRSARTQGGVTLYIAVVGLVYELVLRRLWHPEGAQFIADLLLHDAVPLTVVAHWIFLRERGALQWRDPFAWLVYPGVYLAYALLRGALTGWWAYPFIDASALGYGRVLLNAAGLLMVFLALGMGMVGWDRRHGS
ncbi:MAG TPA: Pr6Pr family membrane protein [Holophagaceae bacterium]|jgi:hypothetical protein|nr:Pr6Pr family membrane protein [Holophagaceae bacterium]